jgi:hypothetical protein
MDEKTEQTSSHRGGCLFCTTLPVIEKMWSDATGDHFRHSRIEFLKGLRSLLDTKISHLSKEQPQAGAHVTVE